MYVLAVHLVNTDARLVQCLKSLKGPMMENAPILKMYQNVQIIMGIWNLKNKN